jgi:hypothetical protein
MPRAYWEIYGTVVTLNQTLEYRRCNRLPAEARIATRWMAGLLRMFG